MSEKPTLTVSQTIEMVKRIDQAAKDVEATTVPCICGGTVTFQVLGPRSARSSCDTCNFRGMS